MTHEVIINDFADAWITLNPELMVKHLSNDFVYDSQWVMESLDCEEYKEYIRGKFETLKEHGVELAVRIVNDPYGEGSMLQLGQGQDICFYRIKVKDDKVYKGDLCMF